MCFVEYPIFIIGIFQKTTASFQICVFVLLSAVLKYPNSWKGIKPVDLSNTAYLCWHYYYTRVYLIKKNSSLNRFFLAIKADICPSASIFQDPHLVYQNENRELPRWAHNPSSSEKNSDQHFTMHLNFTTLPSFRGCLWS